MIQFNLAASTILAFLLLPIQGTAKPAHLTPDTSGNSKIGNKQHQSSIGSECTSSLDCGANGNTACCAFLPSASGTIGICSGCGATTQQGKQGCGFGDQALNLADDPQVCPAGSSASGAVGASPTSAGANALTSSTAGSVAATNGASQETSSGSGAAQAQPAASLPDPNLSAGVGNGNHQQFVTGGCNDSSDCGASIADLSNVCCASVVNSAGQTVGVCSGAAVGNVAPKQGCGFGDGKANSAA